MIINMWLNFGDELEHRLVFKRIDSLFSTFLPLWRVTEVHVFLWTNVELRKAWEIQGNKLYFCWQENLFTT